MTHFSICDVRCLNFLSSQGEEHIFLQDTDFDFSYPASPSCALFVGNMKTVLLTRSLSIKPANIEIQAPERSGAARMGEGGLFQFHVSALYRTN